jgi:hypothetical protein
MSPHPLPVELLASADQRRVSAATAARFNAAGFQTSDAVTRCRADHLTEASRKNFTLSIS